MVKPTIAATAKRIVACVGGAKNECARGRGDCTGAYLAERAAAEVTSGDSAAAEGPATIGPTGERTTKRGRCHPGGEAYRRRSQRQLFGRSWWACVFRNRGAPAAGRVPHGRIRLRQDSHQCELAEARAAVVEKPSSKTAALLQEVFLERARGAAHQHIYKRPVYRAFYQASGRFLEIGMETHGFACSTFSDRVTH